MGMVDFLSLSLEVLNGAFIGEDTKIGGHTYNAIHTHILVQISCNQYKKIINTIKANSLLVLCNFTFLSIKKKESEK